jgi:alkylhydroperoxidase/carboxymuconolactone decarboxylase family protein YurZ/quinol monooxygenase YgiN
MDAQNKTGVSQPLTAQQQSIVTISALTAVGDQGHLKTALNAGLDAGLNINQIKEVLVQLYAYCGFPRSLNGLNTFMAVLKERTAKNMHDVEGPQPAVSTTNGDKYEQGRKVLAMLTKTPQSKPAPGFGQFAPRIDAFLKEHLFADIFESTVLSYQQRELVTIAALAAMTGVESQLASHLVIGKNTGLTDIQLAQVFPLIEKHIGKPQADNGQKVLAKMQTGDQAKRYEWMVRIAKIEVDTAFLPQYKAAIEEHTKAAIAAEPGVLTLYALYEKEHPNRVMVLEIYASREAYQAHIKTPHFLKYKNGTINMVKSLELIDVNPIVLGAKPDFLDNEKDK